MKTAEWFVNTPLLFLLVGTHLYFTVRLRLIQRKIPQGIRLSVAGAKSQSKEGQITAYSALATALAATIGTGNIIGISAAIAIGGPGAVFWCWLTGVFGIATCYAECFLSVAYKRTGRGGESFGGPMYVLGRRLSMPRLASAFALFAVLASFGIGSSVQAHSIRTAADRLISAPAEVTGILIAALAGLVIIGGNRQIAKVCNWLVPVMSAVYLGGCLWILIQNLPLLPDALRLIVRSALSGRAALGGLAGRAVLTGMRVGIQKGLFTNEAGLGSVPMAAAAAQTKDPVMQGLVSMTGPFWDTVVMCAVTGLAIISSMLRHPGRYACAAPEQLCFLAFEELPWGEGLLSVSLALFAFATIIGWNVYGTSAVRYLWGERGILVYQVCYLCFVWLGAVLSMELVWGCSDLLNSLMAFPNLLALWLLRKEIHT